MSNGNLRSHAAAGCHTEGSVHKARPQATLFTPDKRMLALCPRLDGRDSFAPSSDQDSDDKDDEQDAFDTKLAACPKNKLRRYKAPPVIDLPWPQKQQVRLQFEHDLRGIQFRLAILTRPIDKMVLDVVEDPRLKQDQIEEFLDTIGVLLRHVKKISHDVRDVRVRNLYEAHDIGTL
ncbi:hypothetical protein BGZ72_011160 [Mortierella alpina]|nr:hypothetical protein BGZ72_011160 [Mortierella alpina]